MRRSEQKRMSSQVGEQAKYVAKRQDSCFSKLLPHRGRALCLQFMTVELLDQDSGWHIQRECVVAARDLKHSRLGNGAPYQ